MSYTKNNWQTGDVVTADKLNNMENGIEAASSGGGGGGGTFYVHASVAFGATDSPEGTATVQESFDDIRSAIEAGQVVICVIEEMGNFLTRANLDYYGFETENDEYICFQNTVFSFNMDGTAIASSFSVRRVMVMYGGSGEEGVDGSWYAGQAKWSSSAY